MIEKIGIRHAPLTDRLMLCRFGKDPHMALEKRECEPELMNALTDHMMQGSDGKGSKKEYRIGDQWYEIVVRPIDAPAQTGQARD